MARREVHQDFNMPSKGSILGRKSSITAAFFQAITVVIYPSVQEVNEALGILGMNQGVCVCAYCGGPKTEWDHFRPTVIGRKPTGYITEIANLVPACGKCNQSKGNKPWMQWIESEAPLAPKARRPEGLKDRIKRLEDFEIWRDPICIDFIAVIGEEKWNLYLALLDSCEREMRLGHEMSKLIERSVLNSINKH